MDVGRERLVFLLEPAQMQAEHLRGPEARLRNLGSDAPR